MEGTAQPVVRGRLKKAHPDARILGHHDLPGVHKDCPCFDAIKEYKDFL